MAVYVYRNGESALIEPERLQAHLQQGWSVEENAKVVTFEEADTNDTGKLSNAEVRAAAKEAGIDDWDTKRIKSLRQELGYDDE